jgi:hypothetical protein
MGLFGDKDSSMSSITVAFASRFGSTQRLAVQLAAGLLEAGAAPQLVEVSTYPTVAVQPLVLLTPIIWDRPIPAMRKWIAANAVVVRDCTVACGVVCGAAGVRQSGGLVYARQLAKRIGNLDAFQFALGGEIPPRHRMRFWEWLALKAFAGVTRRPQLFSIRADFDKARYVGARIGEQLVNPAGRSR